MTELVTTRAIPDSELPRLLALLEEVDGVELKLTVPEGGHRSTAAALGLDPLDAQIRQVFFFDTPDLALDGHGLVVRARRVQGGTGDTVVKLRPVVPSELPDSLRRSRDLGVEVDAMPGGFVCSASLQGSAGAGAVRQTAAGERPIRKLFSKAQRSFFAEQAPSGIELDDLSVLGPIFVLKAKSRPKGFGRKLVAELWLYPDNTWIFELSTKCAPSDAFQVAAEAREFLAEKGVELAGEQQTKTRRALDFFSQRLKEEPDGRSG